MAVIKAQNEAIRSSRLGRVLDVFPHPSTVANGENRLVYVNDAFSALYGWRETEVLGLTPRFLLDRSFPDSELTRIRREIASASLNWSGQLENITRTGRKILVRVWAVRVSPEPAMPSLYYLGVTVPVVSKVRPEEELTARLAGSMLTDREEGGPQTRSLSRPQQIENLRALGYTTKDIAGILGVAPNSINVALHRERRRTDGRVVKGVRPARGRNA